MQLHALHTLNTIRPGHDENLLPDLPSPTLTNPDHILPAGDPVSLPTPRLVRRPPSPTYLWNASTEDLTEDWPNHRKPDKGRSRKKMLAGKSSNSSLRANERGLGYRKTSNNSMRNGSSSPVSHDMSYTALERPDRSEHLQPPRRRGSGGSSGSDVSGMSTFLEKYKTDDSDEETIDGGGGPVQDDFSETEEMSARRQKQAQEEYNSAVLSTRAEQILANAKARLNVMEGNLRGARSLVAPLTAANLKRAASLGAGTYSPAYSSRARYAAPHETEQTPPRRLHPAVSSPHIGRNYQGHARGFSETVLPERSFSAQEHEISDRTNGTPPRTNELPRERRVLKTPEPSPARQLRGSKSYGSIGSGVGYGVGIDHPLHSGISPLAPLPEGDENRRSQHGRYNSNDSNNGLGIRSPPRSASRALELRDQLTSLKSKMAVLKERQREDSLKRQSKSLRSSPFNNATATSPDMFYTSPSAYLEPGANADAGVGSATSPRTPLSDATTWEFGVAGTSNTFAEQAGAEKHPVQQARVVEIVAGSSPVGGFMVRRPRDMQSTSTSTPSPPRSRPSPIYNGSPSRGAATSPAKSRSAYQHATSSKSSVVSSNGRPETASDDSGTATPPPSTMVRGGVASQSVVPHIDKSVDDDYASSEADSSVYEDAPSSQPPADSFVAHEDREDAFDYQRYFLATTLASYNGARRESVSSSSSGSSVSTVATARAPNVNHESSARKSTLSLFPPPTPRTPERLRAIERGLGLSHRASSSSVSTMNTFATADEDISDDEEYSNHRAISPISELEARESSQFDSRGVSPMGPQNPRFASRSSHHTTAATLEPTTRSLSQQRARYSSQQGWMGSSFQQQQLPAEPSRPSTAHRIPPVRRDSTSDRADSGVGMTKSSPRHTTTATATTVSAPPATSAKQLPADAKSASPSPTTVPPPTTTTTTTRQDPAARAVAALLDPAGRQLGLRDTAVLFGVVESLKRVVAALQEGEEGAYEGKEMRRRLDGARGWLDGRRE